VPHLLDAEVPGAVPNGGIVHGASTGGRRVITAVCAAIPYPPC
jgi:hypothetical protein